MRDAKHAFKYPVSNYVHLGYNQPLIESLHILRQLRGQHLCSYSSYTISLLAFVIYRCFQGFIHFLQRLCGFLESLAMRLQMATWVGQDGVLV